MSDDIVTRLPKNTLRLDCGCLLYVNSPKNHGVTLHCKAHRTKPEIENDEEGLQEKVWWQESEIERLRKLMAEFFNAWTKEIERNNFPSLLLTTIELSEKIEKEIK